MHSTKFTDRAGLHVQERYTQSFFLFVLNSLEAPLFLQISNQHGPHKGFFFSVQGYGEVWN